MPKVANRPTEGITKTVEALPEEPTGIPKGSLVGREAISPVEKSGFIPPVGSENKRLIVLMERLSRRDPPYFGQTIKTV